MGDGWDSAPVLSTILSAFVGGVLALVGQQALQRSTLKVALKADAQGAIRMADATIAQFEAAAAAAETIADRFATGDEITFADVTALPEGWLLTAPTPDLLGNAQRLYEREADAVMQYLHLWNSLLGLEARYRSALEEPLKGLPTQADQQTVHPFVLREYAVRASCNAKEMARTAKLLRAQAVHFAADRLQALTQTEKERAQRQAPTTR